MPAAHYTNQSSYSTPGAGVPTRIFLEFAFYLAPWTLVLLRRLEFGISLRLRASALKSASEKSPQNQYKTRPFSRNVNFYSRDTNYLQL
jgi:hypothetical protein